MRRGCLKARRVVDYTSFFQNGYPGFCIKNDAYTYLLKIGLIYLNILITKLMGCSKSRHLNEPTKKEMQNHAMHLVSY
jgi:hypothetical protein